jgi:BirA family transcriptional regulator, biotin operon repressor / biotin---[acetyl-CoA-carboxylase] ligase
MNWTILRYETLESTNTEAANQARRGAAEGVCILARQQTGGRGRHGRTWVSEKDAGLYFSLILRPKIAPEQLALITLMTGVAVHDALQEFAIKADLKWVNDLHVGGRKIGGILAETVDTPNGLAVIVGIGVNLTSANLPPDLANTATCVEAEAGRFVTADELAESISRYIAYFYELLMDDAYSIVEHWSERSTYHTGKSVRVRLSGEVIEGTTDGLAPDGALRLRTREGELKIIHAGDVEQLRAEGPN